MDITFKQDYLKDLYTGKSTDKKHQFQSGIANDMIANNLEPFYPTHPGEVLKDEIEYRGISQKKLATAMGVPYTSINDVLNAKRPINAELALLKMQTRYNMLVAKRDGKFVEKLKNIRKIAAIF